MCVEIHMPQDVYIYDPNVPVPKYVQHVEIPEGTTFIKNYAFNDCTRLQSITIPDSVTKIGDSAFEKCTGLQSVTIPDSVTEIGDYAFYGCSGLQSVTIPDGVTKIDRYVFGRCSGLQSVTIPDSVTKIGAYAFYDCSAIQSVIIPDSVTEIDRYAFWGCPGLQSVTIPDSVTEIGDNAFSECSGLQTVTIPDSMTKIGDRAFYDCSALESVTIPDSVTEIGESTFWCCSGLQSVTIPDSVTEIGEGAFKWCSGLRSVTIPDSVTEIGEGAFWGCSGLQSVTIPDSMIKIGDYAFDGCSGLQSVTIPDSVTKIGEFAFAGCAGLQSVTIPDGITKISNSAFWGCSGLQSVTIPDTVTEIGNNAFRDCSALQSVTIPDSVTEIGNSAFAGCSALQSAIMPDGATKIGPYAFGDCYSLRSVKIPDGVTEIDDCIFYECSDLKTITIPNSITRIGRKAFCGCSALQSVTVPENVRCIDEYAFFRCSALRSVTIRSDTVCIVRDAFDCRHSVQSFMFKDINIAPFISINGYGANTFSIVQNLIEHHIPLSEHTVRHSIEKSHQYRFGQWLRDYPLFGEMRLSSTARSVDGKTEERLRQCFASQKETGRRIPEILDKLVITACICGIPAERLAETFDIGYTKNLLSKKIPLVPAEACRCYYDRGTCDMLIRKDRISIMAEAISLYNKSGHQECYKHLMDFILSHPDTKIEDLQYAVDHAEEIPMRTGTTLTQVGRHRIYRENLAEVEKIEAKYGKTVPGFKLTDYPCSIEPTDITYDGMTARVLDLSDNKDIALAARLGDLTNCCQRLGRAGETAMMHGFLNPDAGFWVIEDKDGKVKAQAEIWKTNNGNLVFDNIEFADTDDEHLTHRVEQLRGAIAAWAMESGYENIIMGCGFSELGTGFMEQASIPKLCLTPEEVFALQKGNDTCVSFRNMDDVHQYMQTEKYRPGDFVYTDADEQCVYIKKDGIVSDYLMQGYDCTLAEKYPASGYETEKERSGEIACK